MCVAITLKPGCNLSIDEVTKMNRNNADGVGIAWAKDGLVHWWKTTKVDPEYVARAIFMWKDYPRLVHFRLATAGGAKPELCHPFEIGPMASCAVTGSGAKVMIHNGHWHRWDEVKAILDRENLLPNGPWSDSRLAAFLAHDDPEWLQALGGRVAILDGAGQVHRLGDWDKLRDGVMVSNKNWVDAKYTRGGYTGFKAWKGWNWSEEEHKAFWDEQRMMDEEAERQANADVPQEADAPEGSFRHQRQQLNGGKDEWKRLSNRERKELKRQAKADRRAEREAKSRQGDGGGDSERGEEAGGGGNPGNTREVVPDPHPNSHTYSQTALYEPFWDPKLGKWCQLKRLGQTTVVVEAIPPRP